MSREEKKFEVKVDISKISKKIEIKDGTEAKKIGIVEAYLNQRNKEKGKLVTAINDIREVLVDHMRSSQKTKTESEKQVIEWFLQSYQIKTKIKNPDVFKNFAVGVYYYEKFKQSNQDDDLQLAIEYIDKAVNDCGNDPVYTPFATCMLAELQVKECSLSPTKDFKTALDGYKSLAYGEKPYPEACVQLANMYQQGIGIEIKPAEAFNLYLNAAYAGHPKGLVGAAEILLSQEVQPTTCFQLLLAASGTNEAKSYQSTLDNQSLSVEHRDDKLCAIAQNQNQMRIEQSNAALRDSLMKDLKEIQDNHSKGIRFQIIDSKMLKAGLARNATKPIHAAKTSEEKYFVALTLLNRADKRYKEKDSFFNSFLNNKQKEISELRGQAYKLLSDISREEKGNNEWYARAQFKIAELAEQKVSGFEQVSSSRIYDSLAKLYYPPALFKQGEGYLKKGNDRQAYEYFRLSAKLGYFKAQVELASLASKDGNPYTMQANNEFGDALNKSMSQFSQAQTQVGIEKVDVVVDKAISSALVALTVTKTGKPSNNSTELTPLNKTGESDNPKQLMLQ